jgi:hypothetical protein
MHPTPELYDRLIRAAARRRRGHPRRLFQAAVATRLWGGSPHAAAQRFGWGRRAVATGLHEARHGIRCVADHPSEGGCIKRSFFSFQACGQWRHVAVSYSSVSS